MQRKSFAVDYRQFRLSKLNDESFRHLKLLLFWPIYGFFFYFVEKLYSPVRYYPMHCALDDMIPFCELFLIPYLAWFLCIVGMLLYTMLYDIGAFKRFMYFIILTYSVTIVISRDRRGVNRDAVFKSAGKFFRHDGNILLPAEYVAEGKTDKFYIFFADILHDFFS